MILPEHLYDRLRKILPVVLILVTAFVFIRVIDAGFVEWDDPQLVTENAFVQSFSPRIFWSYDPELYIPLTLLTYQIEHVLLGSDPFVFHLMNLLLHLGNVFLVFFLLKQLLASQSSSRTDSLLGAFLGALLFAVHPLQTEAVAWVSARKDLLSTLFFLLSLNAYLRWSGRPSKPYYLSIIFFFLGLLAKVSVLTLPLVLLLLDALRGKPVSRRTLIELWPFLTFSVVFGIIALVGKSSSLTNLSLPMMAWLSVKSFAFALAMIVVPARLSIIYLADHTNHVLPFLPLVCLALFLALCVWSFRRDRPIFVALLFLLITFIPSVLTFWKAGDIYLFSDRYVYLPLVGVGLVVAILAVRSTRSLACFVLLTTVIIAVSCMFGVQSFRRAVVWHDTEALLQDAVAKEPLSHIAHNNLGQYYYKLKDLDKAEHHLALAVEQKPSYAYARNNLGLVALDRGRTQEALEFFESAVVLDPSYAHAYVNLGVWHAKVGNYAKAEEYLFQAISIDPQLAQAHYNLGGVFLKIGRMEAARRAYEETLRIDPLHMNAQLQLKKILQDIGEWPSE